MQFSDLFLCGMIITNFKLLDVMSKLCYVTIFVIFDVNINSWNFVD
jgi:hypothetical protein